MEQKLDTVKLSMIEKAVYQLKSNLNDDEDLELSFEFIIGSFFPTIMNNIKKAFTQNYIQGYNDAKERYLNED